MYKLTAAEEFVKSFYPALDSNRSMISSFYSSTPTNILFNGNQVADGNGVQEIFVNQMPPSRYEAQSFDCQVINRAYPTPTPSGEVKSPQEMTVKDMSFLVIVSGYAQYGSRGIDRNGFSETFVLVPNPNPRPRQGTEWVIQSQNFRLVA